MRTISSLASCFAGVIRGMALSGPVIGTPPGKHSRAQREFMVDRDCGDEQDRPRTVSLGGGMWTVDGPFRAHCGALVDTYAGLFAHQHRCPSCFFDR
jgi:hypothetical protein